MRTSWAWLSQEDIDWFRSEALKFISQSNVPGDECIEWFLTLPKKSLILPDKQQDRKESRGDGRGLVVRKSWDCQELRVTEIGDQLLNDDGTHGLDILVHELAKHQRRRVRSLRFLRFSASAAGYHASLCVGGPSQISRHIEFTCDAPGEEAPEFARSVVALLQKRSSVRMAMRRSYWTWPLTLLFAIGYPAIAVPTLYFGFQHVSGFAEVNSFAEKIAWVACGYLIPLGMMILFSIYLTAARVLLARQGVFKSSASRSIPGLANLIQAIFGPMKRHLAAAGGGLVGAGLTAMLAYVVATASTEARNAPIWPYGIFGGLMIVGITLYVASIADFKHRPQKSNTADNEDLTEAIESPSSARSTE